MYTVCGQAHPHHTRPASAVAAKIVTATSTSSNDSSTLSVGRKVTPRIVNWRLIKSSKIAGRPLMVTNGVRA
jgi:hypothetical protein